MITLWTTGSEILVVLICLKYSEILSTLQEMVLSPYLWPTRFLLRHRPHSFSPDVKDGIPPITSSFIHSIRRISQGVRCLMSTLGAAHVL